MTETITKDYCVKCKAVNYVCHGDIQDVSGCDVDGFKCHSCGNVWLYDDDIDIEDAIIEDGLKEPCVANDPGDDKILLPKELTAENGAKALLIGDFYEEIKVPYDHCGECDDSDCQDCQITDLHHVTQKVTVSWTTIKEIYKKIVEEFGEK